MFLLRKLKSGNIYAFQINLKKIVERVFLYIESDAYSMRNLTSLLYSLSTLSYTINPILGAINRKLQDQNSDYPRDISIYTVSELINGIANNRLFITASDKRLLATVLEIL